MLRPPSELNNADTSSASLELYHLLTNGNADWNNPRIAELIKNADPNYPSHRRKLNIYLLAIAGAPLKIIQLLGSSDKLNDKTLLSYSDFVDLNYGETISQIIPAAMSEALKRKDLAIYQCVSEVWHKLCKPDQITRKKADSLLEKPSAPAVIPPSSSLPSVMIISTATPTESASMTGLASGKSAQIINMAINGDDKKNYVHIHRNKQLTPDEILLFEKNLKSGGWLVITGHGNAGEAVVTGPYVSAASLETAAISCTAREFVTLVMQSACLKGGDNINVALYVCYGGKSLENRESFAQQLAAEFARHRISSSIVASVNRVKRLKGPMDIEDGKLRFGKDKQDLRVFNTTADGVTTIQDAGEDFFFTRNGVLFATQQQPLKRSGLN